MKYVHVYIVVCVWNTFCLLSSVAVTGVAGYHFATRTFTPYRVDVTRPMILQDEQNLPNVVRNQFCPLFSEILPLTTMFHLESQLFSQSASEKRNQENSPQTFAYLVDFSTKKNSVSAMFDNHTILSFWL